MASEVVVLQDRLLSHLELYLHRYFTKSYYGQAQEGLLSPLIISKARSPYCGFAR